MRCEPAAHTCPTCHRSRHDTLKTRTCCTSRGRLPPSPAPIVRLVFTHRSDQQALIRRVLLSRLIVIVWGRQIARIPLNVPTGAQTKSLVQRNIVVLGWSSRLNLQFVIVGRGAGAGSARAER
jgi:hypothetical protein